MAVEVWEPALVVQGQALTGRLVLHHVVVVGIVVKVGRLVPFVTGPVIPNVPSFGLEVGAVCVGGRVKGDEVFLEDLVR